MNILPEVGQVMEFDIMSIIFLVVILISIIVGAFRGFIGSIVSFISSFGSMFFASLFSEQLGNLIYSTEFSSIIYNPIFNWISTQNDGMFNKPLTLETKETLLQEVYSVLNIPEIFHDILNQTITEMIPETGANLSEVVSQSLTLFACSTIAFLGLWLVIFIVFKLLDAFANSFNDMPVLGPINRIFGGAIGLCIGVCICFVVCYVVSLLTTFNVGFANEILLSMKLEDETIWTFSKMLFNNNLITVVIEMLYQG